ncbi:MAG TPA: hypothetical protein ENN45_01600 [Bacteroidetes bacterium]|nr:hypothetical protein [Bacteroidota bacterium]
MKGKATCPECKHNFVLTLPDDKKKHEVQCPKCKSKFSIKAKDEDFSWVEHGEPRKTILSKLKPKTNKPLIAAIILMCVFGLGITTAVFSEAFIESSLDVASVFGLKGNVEINVNNLTNSSVENATLDLNDATKTTNSEGFVKFDDVELGIQTVEVSKQGYKTQKYEIMVVPFFNNKIDANLQEGSGIADTNKFDTLGCSFIIVIFSIFALIGIFACLKRNNLDVAVAGSIIGIFSFGFLFIGSILSIIAFVIIMKSRDEFRNDEKGRTF